MRMRYVRQIFDEWHRFKSEENLMNFKKSVGREPGLPFYDMDMETYQRRFNTLSWLNRLSIPHFKEVANATKPTNEEIKEVMVPIREEGESLLLHAKKYPVGDLRTGLRKMAKKSIECADYYDELVAKDFFKDKEIK